MYRSSSGNEAKHAYDYMNYNEDSDSYEYNNRSFYISHVIKRMYEFRFLSGEYDVFMNNCSCI